MSSPSPQYRPDVDGLRAIAVLLVMNYHAFPEAIPGGFIGVDIFFVISGFLITGIIARDLDLKRFSLVGFYVRRIRRIFPALIVVLCAALVLGSLWMLPAAYAQLGSDVFASAAFFANIALLLQSGYFDIESAKKPLLHLWSLGIEEQFYLFWPLLLMLAVRLRLSIVAVASILGVGSFLLNVALIGSDPVATFYLPFTRAFELLAGAVLARGWSGISQTGAAGNLRALIGVGLIAVAAAVLDPHRAFPGWWAILPVAGAALLLSAPGAWFCRVVLASRPLVGIGLVSYPLYLWHWPLLVFFTIIKFNPLTLLERELVLLASGLLAWATYQYVEKPFRFGAPRPRRIFALCTGMVLVAVAGSAIVWGRGFDFRLPAEMHAMANVPTQNSKWRFHRCLLDLSHEMSFADDCVDRSRRPLVLVWGDSTAGALMPGLLKAQQTRNFGIGQLTSSSCIPALNADIPSTPDCRAINDKVLSLVRDIRPDIVLLHGTWEKHLDHVAETVVALKTLTTARVVVLGGVPAWRRGLPSEVLHYFMLHRRLIPARSNAAAQSNGYDAVMRAKLVPLGAEFISASDALCDEDGCVTRIGDSAGDISTSDQVHLTEKGSEYLVNAVIDRLLGGPAPASNPLN
ncbi:acyltransferase family protein [Bradyrhizobium sp. Ash2021]|uniref:acyltransferase family protein n=1 Tax=Bradyrhizobium sp. Ash2021 TaxID=2954771 RepID=UPI0028156DDA|nr:acyltransferase family protein [Bradyrhizobium sp. Ash2021]WMT74875.1 acyltransferase [Bradyrhizobium sp. Ash2021]